MSRWLLSCLIVLGFLATARADDPPKKDAPAPQAKEAAEKPKAGDDAPADKPAGETRKLPGQQEIDDVPEVLKPVKPRSLADDNRLKAGSWLATGRILEAKSDPQGALEAYKKALTFAPQSAEVYRALVGAAIKLNMNEEVLEWAQKVTELDPDEGVFRVQLGEIHLRQNDIPGALKYWEEALKSSRLKKDSPRLYVTVNRQIGLLYMQLGRKEDAANAIEIVFNALTDGGEVRIDFETKTQLLGTDPAGTFEAFGEVFLESKKYETAIKAFEKASLRKPGGSATLNYNLARVLLETDKGDKALEELQKYFHAQRQGKGRAAYELLGQILKKLGKENELLSRLETMAAKDSRNSDLQYYLADQYRRANRLDDAKRIYQKTILFAANLEGYQGLASIYRQEGKPAELLEMLGKAYEESKEDIDLLETELKAIAADEKLLISVQQAAEALRKESKLNFHTSVAAAYLMSKGDRQEPAAELFRYALSLRPTKEVYFGLVDVLFDQRKYLEAVKILKEAEEDAANSQEQINYLFTLIRAREFAGDTPGALESLNKLKGISPELAKNDQITYQEAWIYYHSQRYDEAIPKFEQLIAKGSNKTVVRQAQFSLSNIYVLKGDYKKGEEILEVVYKEEPNDPSVNNDLGYLYADQGKNLEQAEKMIKLALEKEPENGAYLDSMGWVLFKLGKATEAIPYLEKAIKKSTGSGDETLYDHLGDAYDKTQQPAKALEAWKTAAKHAKEASRPDPKLIQKIEDKIKSREGDQGKVKPATPGSP